MNKINAVRGMFPGPELWTYPQDQTAAAIAALAGQRPTHSGMQVSWSASDSRIMVAKGQAFTSAGIIRLAAPAPVDVSAVARPSAGHYAWLRVVVTNETTERGTIRDYRGTAHPEYYLDAATPSTVLGAPFAAANRGAALIDLDNRPAAPAGAVVAATILIDATSTWASMVSDAWQGPIPLVSFPPVTGRRRQGGGASVTGVTEAVRQMMVRGVQTAPAIGAMANTSIGGVAAILSATVTSRKVNVADLSDTIYLIVTDTRTAPGNAFAIYESPDSLSTVYDVSFVISLI